MKRILGLASVLWLIAFAAFGQAPDGWVTLLDAGKPGEWDRTGDANWRIEGGVMMADAKNGKDNGFLVTKQSYGDFAVRAEFWVSDDANSGIFIRCEHGKVTSVDCYEVNIFDQRPDPNYGTGAITNNTARVVPMPKAGGRWNVLEIVAQGSHLVVVLNGEKTVDIQDGKHAAGPLALQYGQGVVKFRKVQMRKL